MPSIYSVRPVPTLKPADGIYSGTHEGSRVYFETPQGRFEGLTQSRDCIWGKKKVSVTVTNGHTRIEYIETEPQRKNYAIPIKR
jgi:hypothetical protein